MIHLRVHSPLYRSFLVLITVLFLGGSVHSQETILLTQDELSRSQCTSASILEDADHALSIENILQQELDFKPMQNEMEILDFNSSRWWIRFSVLNPNGSNEFLLETARPITDKVVLYQVAGDSVAEKWVNGDDFAFDEKDIPHRKCLFPIHLEQGVEYSFVLMLESDGEMINLPLTIWESKSFFVSDYHNQLWHGLYYGILLLVAIIFFFFYRLLKDLSFLYYVLYVIGQMALQFSLDGYMFQYVFPANTYMANHMVLLSAGFTAFFLLYYAKTYLKTAERHRGFHKIFNYSSIVVVIVTLYSMVPHPSYSIIYPVINGVSLISIIAILVAIYRLNKLGHKINVWFGIAMYIFIAGAIIFILGNFNVVGNAELSLFAIKASSALEVVALSISMASKYRDLQAEKEVAQQEALDQLEEKNQLMDEINVRLEQQVKERTAEIEHQKEQLAEKNTEILDSIRYAQRIQKAILPPDEIIEKYLPESFILYRPKDIVAGDFYWMEQSEGQVMFAAADCTGHGVPGAMVSVVCHNALNRSVREFGLTEPGLILDRTTDIVISEFERSSNDVKDGMDISLCTYDPTSRILLWAGANNPLWVIRNNELLETRATKQPVGKFDGRKPFETHRYELQENDMIYIFSDGYPDQFGGPKGKKYKSANLKSLLLSLHELGMQEQLDKLNAEFDSWKQDMEQIDDICIIGVRIK